MRRISPLCPLGLAFGDSVHFLGPGISGVVVGLLVFPFADCRWRIPEVAGRWRSAICAIVKVDPRDVVGCARLG